MEKVRSIPGLWVALLVYIFVTSPPIWASQACMEAFQGYRESPEVLKVKAELRRLGKAIGVAKAQDVLDQISMHEYLTQALETEVPDGLREQLEWVAIHPLFFTDLWEGGVRPLDVADVFGRPITVVEHLWQVIVSKGESLETPSKDRLESEWKREIRYHLLNPFGAKGSRGNEEFGQVIARRRPELYNFFRPSEVVALQRKADELRRTLNRLHSVEQKKRRFKVGRPGWIIESALPQWPSDPIQKLFRQSWMSFERVEDAVLHLLNGGEHAQTFRDWENRSRSTWSILREILQLSRKRLEDIASISTTSNFSPKKFFVSASAQRLEGFGEEVGNLRIAIRTTRAIKVPSTMSNLGESEYGIPFVLNPIEVLGGELSDNKNTPTRFTFYWSTDYGHLEVDVQGANESGRLKFRYDPLIKAYVQQVGQ